MSQNIQKGFTFSGTSPNNNVTASSLNTLADGSIILTGFFTEKTEKTSAAAGDFALLYDPVANAYRKIQIGNLVGTAYSRTGAQNLYAVGSSDSGISVTADEIIMRSGAGALHYAAAFSQAADISTFTGTSTPNGRDAVNEIADSWYYFFAISDGTNDRLLLSLSPSAPTLPTGYLYKCLLGAVRNNHTSDFVRFVQRGIEVAISPASVAGAANTSPYLNPWTGATPAEFTDIAVDVASTLQTADLTRCIPPNASRVRGILGSTDTTAGTFLYAVSSFGTSAIATAMTQVLEGIQIVRATTTAAKLINFTNAINFDMVPSPSGTSLISWTANQTSAKLNMRVTGYQLNL